MISFQKENKNTMEGYVVCVCLRILVGRLETLDKLSFTDLGKDPREVKKQWLLDMECQE